MARFPKRPREIWIILSQSGYGQVPYEFIGFGVMDGSFPYEFIGFGAVDCNFPYEFIGLWA